MRTGKLQDMKPLRPLAFLRRKSGDESVIDTVVVKTPDAVASTVAGAAPGTIESAVENALQSTAKSTASRIERVAVDSAARDRTVLERGALASTRPVKAVRPNVMAGGRSLPRPALRWVGPAGRIALRPFDFAADADAVCAFQEETYSINFPDFRYTDSFAQAFRHDLRRAALDSNHAVFVLDDGAVCGFLWLVICENNWTRERYGYVNNLYLSPSRRGQGLARELMTQSDTWFRSRRIRHVRLTVTTSNDEAVQLYENCGYRVTRWEMEKEL